MLQPRSDRSSEVRSPLPPSKRESRLTDRDVDPMEAAEPSVHELMTKDVRTIGPDASLADAARVMWERDCGFLPVTDRADGRLLGVITDRDACMAALMHGAPLHQLMVNDAMSKAVMSCTIGDDVEQAHSLMRQHQIHRLPVLDGDGRLAGVLSIHDLALRALQRDGDGRQQQCADVGETIAQIGRPRDLRPAD
jgi:CBS domain-containing protein